MPKPEAAKIDLCWTKTQSLSPGAIDLLDDEERAIAASLPQSSRASYVAAHALLRLTLSRWEARAPSSWRFERGDHGKPFLKDSRLRFNLSHSAHHAVVGVSGAAEIGVDVEEMEPHRADDQIAQRMFSSLDYQQWVDASDKVETFFKLWTLKEAYMKATGLGLHLPSQDFSVQASLPQLIHRKLARTDWHLYSQMIDSKTILGLAARPDSDGAPVVTLRACSL